MGFYFRGEFDSNELSKDYIDDIEAQIDFHKNKFLNEDVELVAEVLKRCMVELASSLPEEVSEASLPMLSALTEALLELRATNEVLHGELIEKKSPPPPDGFEFN